MTEITEETSEKNESNSRTRYSLKPFSHLLRDSDDSDDGNDLDDFEQSDEYSESEDEWSVSNNKKRKKKAVSINVTPVQTLKKKLAEKTKALRKSVIKSNKTVEPVETSKSQPDEINTQTETPVVKPLEVEAAHEVKVEKTDLTVKIENLGNTDIAEVKKIPESIITDVKIKKTETISLEEKSKSKEPVVLTYSTIKNSSNISPFLLSNGPSNVSPNTSSFDISATPVVAPPTSLPVPVITSPSLTTPVSSIISTPGASPINTNLMSPAPRIRIRSNLQASPAFRDSLTVPSRPVTTPVIPNAPRPRLRTPTPRAPRARAPRTPSFQRSPVPSVPMNNVGKPRKPVSSPVPAAHTRPFGGLQSSASPKMAASNAQKTPNLKDSTSLKNISPSGAVIYSGSNSVTITPRKIVPEKPPVQRKLFKNEIEGIIAVRHENGVLKYVVNLANGTHMPLTDLQVSKLREQNGGRLPPKLKIPVPSDVAAKIEPSYLIED